MTKRKHQLLTESERGQILAIPTDGSVAKIGGSQR